MAVGAKKDFHSPLLKVQLIWLVMRMVMRMVMGVPKVSQTGTAASRSQDNQPYRSIALCNLLGVADKAE